MQKSLISTNLYRKFTSQLPLACIEMVVESNGRFVLVKRKSLPCKNQWWFPGGRVFFNETLLGTAKRKLEEELGIKKIKSVKFLGIGESRFKKGYFNLPSHTINSIFLVRISDSEAKNIKLDRIGHSDYRWQKKIPKGISPYLKKFLKKSDFK